MPPWGSLGGYWLFRYCFRLRFGLRFWCPQVPFCARIGQNRPNEINLLVFQHLSWGQGVAGSNPVVPTIHSIAMRRMNAKGPVRQRLRAARQRSEAAAAGENSVSSSTGMLFQELLQQPF